MRRVMQIVIFFHQGWWQWWRTQNFFKKRPCSNISSVYNIYTYKSCKTFSSSKETRQTGIFGHRYRSGNGLAGLLFGLGGTSLGQNHGRSSIFFIWRSNFCWGTHQQVRRRSTFVGFDSSDVSSDWRRAVSRGRGRCRRRPRRFGGCRRTNATSGGRHVSRLNGHSGGRVGVQISVVVMNFKFVLHWARFPRGEQRDRSGDLFRSF